MSYRSKNKKGIKESKTCSICGTDGLLTFDHVPPKGCVTPQAVDLVPVGTFLLSNPNLAWGEFKDGQISQPESIPSGIPRSAISQNGLKFRSICSKCNNTLLGGYYDPELKRVSKQVSQLVRAWMLGIQLSPSFRVKIITHRLMKAVIGHLLAASSFEQTYTNPFYQSLREYFLASDLPLPESVRIYFWVFPSPMQVIVKWLTIIDSESSIFVIGDLLKFFPLAFFVADENASTGVLQTSYIVGGGCNVMDCEIDISFDLSQVPPINWPETPSPLHSVIMYPGAGVITRSRDIKKVAACSHQHVYQK